MRVLFVTVVLAALTGAALAGNFCSPKCSDCNGKRARCQADVKGCVWDDETTSCNAAKEEPKEEEPEEENLYDCNMANALPTKRRVRDKCDKHENCEYLKQKKKCIHAPHSTGEIDSETGVEIEEGEEEEAPKCGKAKNSRQCNKIKGCVYMKAKKKCAVRPVETDDDEADEGTDSSTGMDSSTGTAVNAADDKVCRSLNSQNPKKRKRNCESRAKCQFVGGVCSAKASSSSGDTGAASNKAPATKPTGPPKPNCSTKKPSQDKNNNMDNTLYNCQSNCNQNRWCQGSEEQPIRKCLPKNQCNAKGDTQKYNKDYHKPPGTPTTNYQKMQHDVACEGATDYIQSSKLNEINGMTDFVHCKILCNEHPQCGRILFGATASATCKKNPSKCYSTGDKRSCKLLRFEWCETHGDCKHHCNDYKANGGYEVWGWNYAELAKKGVKAVDWVIPPAPKGEHPHLWGLFFERANGTETSPCFMYRGQKDKCMAQRQENGCGFNDAEQLCGKLIVMYERGKLTPYLIVNEIEDARLVTKRNCKMTKDNNFPVTGLKPDYDCNVGEGKKKKKKRLLSPVEEDNSRIVLTDQLHLGDVVAYSM